MTATDAASTPPHALPGWDYVPSGLWERRLPLFVLSVRVEALTAPPTFTPYVRHTANARLWLPPAASLAAAQLSAERHAAGVLRTTLESLERSPREREHEREHEGAPCGAD